MQTINEETLLGFGGEERERRGERDKNEKAVGEREFKRLYMRYKTMLRFLILTIVLIPGVAYNF